MVQGHQLLLNLTGTGIDTKNFDKGTLVIEPDPENPTKFEWSVHVMIKINQYINSWFQGFSKSTPTYISGDFAKFSVPPNPLSRHLLVPGNPELVVPDLVMP